MNPQRDRQPPSPGFAPVRMDEVELSEPLPRLEQGMGRIGTPYGSSICMVRLHGEPLGLVEVPLPPEGLEPARLASLVGDRLAAELRRHLQKDGLPYESPNPEGFGMTRQPACEARREDQLERVPSVSVVICTRNRPDSVQETIRSILGCRYPWERCELIVVDNAAQGDAAVQLEQLDPGPVSLRVEREPEPGLSNARNKGIESAGGEIVVFADDDVTVDRDWLLRLAFPFVADRRVGATSGMTLPGALENPVQYWTEGFGGRESDFQERIFDLHNPPPDRPLFPFTVGEFGAGRNMAFRRDLLRRLGGFDPALGPGTVAHDGDDIEALLRVLLSGNQIVHDPAAIVWHAHPFDYRELEQRVFGYGIGLSACLTRAVLDRPSLLAEIARKLPAGLFFAISPRSTKNRGRQPDFPRNLARRELLGLAYGPVAYARSRRHRRRRERALGTERRQVPGGDGKLNVLLVSDEYRPVVGGAARSAELLARHMTERGHRITVATAWQPEAPEWEMEGGIAIHRVRDLTTRLPGLSEDPYRHHAPPFPDPEAVWRLRRLIRRTKPDVVHAYGWLAHSTAAAMIGIDTPLLLSARDYGNFCSVFTLVRNGERCSGPSPLKCAGCAASSYGAAKGALAVGSVFGSKPLLRRKVTAIHGVSRFVTEAAKEHLRLPRAMVEVVPNFHEENSGSVQPDIMDALPKQPYIQFVGHLRRYKGLFDLLEAYERIEDPPPLVLVGTRGPDTPEAFPKGVTVLTYVPHPTVMAMWERSLFAVSPSIAPEALGNVVHEAMSKGRAVIGTRDSGHEEMIEDGVTGMLVPCKDPPALQAAMERLIDDPELRERIGGNAAKRARRFTPEVVMPELENLYYEAIVHHERDRT
jgi:glycosyltransferase involved in cell wall biosynthesis